MPCAVRYWPRACVVCFGGIVFFSFRVSGNNCLLLFGEKNRSEFKLYFYLILEIYIEILKKRQVVAVVQSQTRTDNDGTM